MPVAEVGPKRCRQLRGPGPQFVIQKETVDRPVVVVIGVEDGMAILGQSLDVGGLREEAVYRRIGEVPGVPLFHHRVERAEHQGERGLGPDQWYALHLLDGVRGLGPDLLVGLIQWREIGVTIMD